MLNIKCIDCAEGDGEHICFLAKPKIVGDSCQDYKKDPWVCECGTELSRRIYSEKDGNFTQQYVEKYCPKCEGGAK